MADPNPSREGRNAHIPDELRPSDGELNTAASKNLFQLTVIGGQAGSISSLSVSPSPDLCRKLRYTRRILPPTSRNLFRLFPEIFDPISGKSIYVGLQTCRQTPGRSSKTGGIGMFGRTGVATP